MLPDLRKSLKTVLSRHHNIQNQYIKIRLIQQVDCFLRIFRLLALESLQFCVSRYQFSQMHVIIRVGDISNNPYYVKTYSNNVLQLLKSDEMNAEFDSLAGSLKETLNDKAIKRYPVKKLEGFRS